MPAIRFRHSQAAPRYRFLWLPAPADGRSFGHLPALSGSFSLMLHGQDHGRRPA